VSDHRQAPTSLVIVDLGIAPGFTVDPGDFAERVVLRLADDGNATLGLGADLVGLAPRTLLLDGVGQLVKAAQDLRGNGRRSVPPSPSWRADAADPGQRKRRGEQQQPRRWMSSRALGEWVPASCERLT
jgi:hypothetical protein